VSFTYHDNQAGGHLKELTVTAVEFIRRFLWHVLPDGFVRIRYYGLHHSQARAETAALPGAIGAGGGVAGSQVVSAGGLVRRGGRGGAASLPFLRGVWHPELSRRCGGPVVAVADVESAAGVGAGVAAPGGAGMRRPGAWEGWSPPVGRNRARSERPCA